MNRLAWGLGLVVTLAGFGGCVAAPEHCRGCLAALTSDAGDHDAPVTDGNGSGGRNGDAGPVVGTGGTVGSGGAPGTGGAGTGGMATGGAGTGGSGTGGAGGSATGGRGTGGANATGGRGTGGAGTGGAGTGGAGTGGAGTGGAGTGGAGTGGAPDQGVVLRYAFDEAGGMVAVDSSGAAGGPRNGTVTNAGAGTATFATAAPLQIGTHYLNLLGTSATDGGYVVTPNLGVLQTLTPGAITIACWVYIGTDTNYQRVFDFGIQPATGNPMIYMYLTTRQVATTPNSVRFTITTTGNSAQQQLLQNTTLLPTNSWHHIAVVLPAGATYTGTLYIDGVSAATNNAMTIHPANLTGTGTPYGFIGKSAFPNDFLFNGRFDDFRVYNRALPVADIMALFLVR